MEHPMSAATAQASHPHAAAPLRNLYFVRAAVSVVWVALVALLAANVTVANATVANAPSVVAVVLLAVYPAWDVAATFFDIRATGSASSHLTQYVNIVVGVATVVAILIALAFGLTPGLIVFGAWAFASGAVQLILGLRRRRPLGGQWPMIISGGLSVLAGISFVATSGAPKTSLATLAGYSAFGAFWYLVGGILLIRSARRPSVVVK
jgi:uncharacterized membrane protein HdeD (DUF308 family)